MDLAKKKCVPCEEGTPPFTRSQAQKYLGIVNTSRHSGERSDSRIKQKADSGQARMTNQSHWEIVEENGKFKIRKKLKFNTYMDGIKFVDKVAKLAEENDHHPDLEVGWRRVTVNFMTHNIGGLSQNDFVMAAKIDKL